MATEQTNATQGDVESNRPQNAASGSQNQSYPYGILNKGLPFDPILILFIILLLIGGLIGFISKGSVASIVSSAIFAALLVICGYIDGVRRNAYPLVVVLLVLFAMMAYRSFQSGVFMPAGLVALLTLVMLSRHIFLLYLRFQMRTD